MFPRKTIKPERLAYSVMEACEAIGIGKTTLYGLLKEKKLRAIKVGNRTLIEASELDRLLGQAEEYIPK